MRKNLQLVAALCGLAFSTNTFAQRYATETFTSVNTTNAVVYGSNISVLTGTPSASNLLMDVYEPTGDVITARPLVIIFHTGSFLPAVANGQATGSRKDSAVVAMCTQFAKRGYVAVAADYRLGWNALSSSQETRTGTLLNAVYRAVQDARNCVRFFRDDAASANTYKIDVNKIAVGGLGSGGYIALAVGTLNKTAEIQLNKFIDFTQTPPAPYVNQALSGNFDGTDATPLNTPNYATYSSTVNVVFNIGGAMGDSTWLEAGEVPVISMQCYKDPYAPYKTGNVIVPTTGQFVVEASGSYDVNRRAKRLGTNGIFASTIYTDAFSTKANANNDGIPALYPFITPAPGANLSCTGLNTNPQTEQGSPWDWWNETVFIASYNAYSGTSNGTAVNCLQKTGNPNMSATNGRLYIDTIQGYLNPRLICAMDLAPCQHVGINENTNAANLSVFPNPATSDINFAIIGGNTISKVKLFDATGRLVMSTEGLNVTEYKVNRNGLNSGLYFTTIELNNKSVVTKKVIID